MKKSILSVVAIAALSFGAASQQTHSCGTPSPYRADLLEYFDNAEGATLGSQAKMSTYKIPVVFHVLHDNGIGNISEEQIQSALDQLNEDFQRLNSDTSDTRQTANAPFKQFAAGMDIEFQLAKIDPSGNCTNGIIRKNVGNSNTTYNVPSNYPTNEPHKHTSSGGSDAWPRTRYFNIWVVNSIGTGPGIIYGYAQFPGWPDNSNTYGITIRHDDLGTLGTATSGGTRTLTHEVGHCFNLIHTFEPGGGSSGCTNGDSVNDTPPSNDQTGFTCNQTQNTCSNVPGGDPYGTDVYDQIENYMSYSLCQNMFSQGQVARMENAFSTYSHLSQLGGGNVNQTGFGLPAALCQAEFQADRTTVCVGGSVQFEDMTFNLVNGWSWSFDGGTPATSTSQNPSVTYNTPGLYEVTLVATDGQSSNTETKTAYIRVLPESAWIPNVEGFEAYSTFDNNAKWEVVNPGNNAKWEVTSSTGHSGANSAKLPNFGQGSGNFDELISSPVDLSSVTSQTNMTLSFRYAYRKRSSGNSETLKVFVTGDCGETWAPRKTLFGDALGADVSTTAWTPSSQADWVTVHMTNVTSNYWVDNFRYKFQFESGGGNNLYIDDINIYTGSPSDNIVVGIEEQETIGHITVFPNPTEGDLTVRFDAPAAQQVELNIVDITGKVIKTNTINALAGANMVVLGTEELASGMYFLNMNGSAGASIQFIVK